MELIHEAYCRKSSDRDDRQTLSNPAQYRILKDLTDRDGLNVKHWYQESKSAYKVGRPDLNKALDCIERGEANALLVYHATRLARNSFDGGRIIYMMDQGLLKEIRTPEKIFLNNADDKFMLQIHFAMAKKSSDDTSQFVKRDVQSKLLKGEYPGMVPHGYLNIDRNGHITKAQDDPEKYMMLLKLGRPLIRAEKDPIDAPLVKLFFDEAEKGVKTIPLLRTFAYDIGLRSRKGGKLSRHAIENMLTNPYYYGVIELRGQIYSDEDIQMQTGDPTRKIQHEPLITQEQFERVQYAIRKYCKGRYRTHRFAFGGCIVACGDCGCPVTAERKKGHVYYHCTYNRGRCSQIKWMREEKMEEAFHQVLLNLSLPQEFITEAMKKTRRVFRDEADSLGGMRRKLQGQYNACQQKLKNLLQLKIAEGNEQGTLLSNAEYLAQKMELTLELQTIEKQLQSHNQNDCTWLDDCERFFDFTQALRRSFTVSSVDDKKHLLNLLCQNLTLKDQKFAVVYREPFATLAKFALAGREPKTPIEPEKELLEAKKIAFDFGCLNFRRVRGV